MGWTVKRWDKKYNQVYSLICQCLHLFTMVTIFQVNLNLNTLNHKWRNSYTIKCLWLIDIKSVRSISYYFCCIKSNGLYITKNSTFLVSNQLTISIHCPAIVLSMFMLSFILVIVCDLFECKGICTSFFLYCLFISVLSLEIQLSQMRFGIQFTSLTLSHLCACHKPGPWFPLT